MPAFRYIAQDQEAAVVKGRLDAKDLDSAIHDIQIRGFLILTINEEAAGGTNVISGWMERLFKTLPGDSEHRDFARDLAMLLRGGVAIMRAMSMLARKARLPVMQEALFGVARSLATGKALGVSLSASPDVFPPLLIALARVGEESGQLPETLGHFSAYMERRIELRRKVVGAATYPTIVISFALGVVILLCTKVVPTFAQVFADFKVSLPPATAAVLAFSRLLTEEWLGLLCLAGGAYLAGAYYLDTEHGKEQRALFLRDAPVLGLMYRDACEEKFFATLALLIRSGVSLLTSLQNIHALYSGDPVYQRAIDALSRDIARGIPISSALRKASVFDSNDVDTIEVSEESGSLVDTLTVLGRFHAERLDMYARQLAVILEPVMVVVVGGLVGFIMMSLFFPMIELTQVQIK